MTSKRTEAAPTSGKSRVSKLLGVVALLSLAAGLAVEHENRLELQKERQTLGEQWDRVTDLLAANEQQTNRQPAVNPARLPGGDSSAELLRLRAEVGALRELTNEWACASDENKEAHAALDRYVLEATPKPATADFSPRDSWSFAGYASPDDALRSCLWASENGNLEVLFDGMTGRFLQIARDELTGKSADEAAIRAMDEVVNLKSVEVLSREYQSADTAVLTAAFGEGTQTRTNRFLVKLIGDHWKLAGVNAH